MSDPTPSLYGQEPESPRPPAPSLMDQVAGVFTAPSELFERLHRSPSWGWATGLLTGFALVMVVIWGLKVDVEEMIRPVLERNPRIDPAQIDTILDMQKKFILPFGILGALFGTVAAVALFALLYWLVGRGFSEKESPSYLQSLSAAAVPGLVKLPYLLLIALICLLKPIGGLTPEKIPPTSLGFFLHPGSLKLHALLYSADLFTLATLGLSYLALRKITGLKVSGALLCLGVPLLLGLGMTLLRAQ